MVSQWIPRVSAVSEKERKENKSERVAESSPGEWNKIEAGGRVSQWIFRVSTVSESKRKENRREGVAGCPSEALETGRGGEGWVACSKGGQQLVL